MKQNHVSCHYFQHTVVNKVSLFFLWGWGGGSDGTRGYPLPHWLNRGYHFPELDHSVGASYGATLLNGVIYINIFGRSWDIWRANNSHSPVLICGVILDHWPSSTEHRVKLKLSNCTLSASHSRIPVAVQGHITTALKSQTLKSFILVFLLTTGDKVRVVYTISESQTPLRASPDFYYNGFTGFRIWVILRVNMC